MNIQFILDRSDKNSKVYVIEVNPRSSEQFHLFQKQLDSDDRFGGRLYAR